MSAAATPSSGREEDLRREGESWEEWRARVPELAAADARDRMIAAREERRRAIQQAEHDARQPASTLLRIEALLEEILSELRAAHEREHETVPG